MSEIQVGQTYTKQTSGVTLTAEVTRIIFGYGGTNNRVEFTITDSRSERQTFHRLPTNHFLAAWVR